MDAAGRLGRVPRALRRDPLLRPRPDARCSGALPLESAYADLRLFRGRELTRGRRRHRLEPRRPGLPAAALRRSPCARSPSGSTATRRSTSSLFLRGRRRRRAPRRRGASLPARRRRLATSRAPPSSTTPTRSRAWAALAQPERRRRARLGRRRASSSPTSAGATTPAAAATARSAPATPRCRCWRSASTLLPASITEIAPACSALRRRAAAVRPAARRCRLTTLAAARRRMVDEQLRGRGIADERVLAAMERVPRELFVPEPQRRRAYADAALPIGEGQTISQPYMVAPHLRGARAARGRARARRRHRVRLPGCGARRAGRPRCTRSSGCRRSPSARARRSSPPATTASRCTSATGRSGLPEHAPFARDRGRRRGARGAAVAVRAARARRPARRPGRRPLRPGAAGRRAQPGRAGRAPLRPLPLRPARRRGGLRPGRPSGRTCAVPSPAWRDRRSGHRGRRVPAGRCSRPQNWLELLKFSVVGASGYVVNLAVYVALLKGAGLHYLPAAVCSFVVAVSNNYFWNRQLDVPSPPRARLLPGDALPRRLARRARAQPPAAPRARRARRGQDRRRRRSRSCS